MAARQLGSCASSGHAWLLWAARHSQEEACLLRVKPLPRVLELAASTAADFTAFDHRPEGKVRKNEQFKPKTKKDQETDELMASLQNMPGMGGQGLSMMSGSDLDLGDGKVNEEDVLKDEV